MERNHDIDDEEVDADSSNENVHKESDIEECVDSGKYMCL